MRTATELVALARKFDPATTITALTLQAHSASTKILERLGFKIFGNTRDADAGEVWEWRN
jgi:hypothetical protein